MFRRAPVWAQIMTVGFLAAKMGAFRGAGKLAAMMFLRRFAPTVAAAMGGEMAAAGMGAKMGTLGGRYGRAFGKGFVAIAAILIAKEIYDKLKEPGLTAPKIEIQIDKQQKRVKALKEAGAPLADQLHAADRLRRLQGKLKPVGPKNTGDESINRKKAGLPPLPAVPGHLKPVAGLRLTPAKTREGPTKTQQASLVGVQPR